MLQHTINNTTGKVTIAQVLRIAQWTFSADEDGLPIGFIDTATGELQINVKHDLAIYNIFMTFVNALMPVAWE